VRLGPEPNSINVLTSSENETLLQYRIGSFDQEEVKIDGDIWNDVRLPKEGISQDQGFPQLPVFNRSIIIPDQAAMDLQVFDIQYQDIKLAVAPSKGVITRDVDPSTVPYTFGPIYQSRGFYPEQLAQLSDPYILRDFRGLTVQTSPFAYDPSTGTLRIYTSFKVRVFSTGFSSQNGIYGARDRISRTFLPIYENHFLNYGSYRYTPVDDSYGKLLVICHSNYMSTILPYVNWKKQKGVETELIEWSTIGSTATQLQTYIQNRFNADNTITYVQLVGDAPQIPSLSSGGGGSDPSFALVAGSDNYPDIFIGRFSAETAAQVTAQIDKAIIYERDLGTTDNWLTRALGIASAEGGGTQGDMGESDIAHMNLIRTDLLNFGYSSVDQVYDPGASATTVSTNVNAGRGFINYVGHGSNTSWSTTGFSSTNASALTNGTKTPFIMDVACVNGNFVSITCFAEAWQRNANGGSVAIYASSINQSWNSPMRAQDEVTDLLTAETKNTVGGLYYNGSCKMMDIYGNTTGSDGVNMFKTWHIFGDASLMARTKTPLAMTVTHPASIVNGTTSINVSTGVANTLVAITYNNSIYGRGFTNSSGNASITLTNPPVGVLNYIITATVFNRVTYVGTIAQTVASGPWMEVMTATWDDANNDLPEYGESGYLDVSFTNSGTATAMNVTATLSSSTPGVLITDATEFISSLAAGSALPVQAAFSFALADDIANDTALSFTITMVGSSTWTGNFQLTAHAPQLVFGTLSINDPSGNNNGRLDPGETATLILPLNNSGGAASPSGSVNLTCSTPGVTVLSGLANFSSITAGFGASLSFTVSVEPGVEIGTMANLVFTASAGAYSAGKTETLSIGIILEDFETGSFNSFPWTFSGNLPWLIVNTGALNGSYAAKSGVITHSQTSTMQTVRILSSPGTVSFWYKVSSESGYDYLRFYVDGVQISQWAGTVNWTQYTHNLAAGTHTLAWTYYKDGSVSSGSDCAWVDDIIFPASTAPSSYNPPQSLTASPGNGLVNLSWQAPVSGTPTGYKIFRNSSLLTTITGLSYTDSAVVNENTYNYYLKAVYTGGESDPTATVTATPTAVVVTEVIIGSGTSSNDTTAACPINVYYESLHGQAVYTAAELNSAGMVGPVNITQIGFNVTGLPSLAMPDYLVRMGHTSSINVASWISTGLSQVWSATSYQPGTTGWNMLTLNTPFAWNGTDNIIVDTAYGDIGAWTQSGSTQYTSITSGYRYVRSDTADQTNVFTGGSTSSYRPNLKLVFAIPQTGPAIAVSPGSVSATAHEGASTTATVTVSNPGTASLSWSTGESISTWGSVSPISGTLEAGTNAELTLTLSAEGLAVGSYDSSLVISSNASNQPELSIPVSFSVTASPYPFQPSFVAEWEPAQGALIRYPFGQPNALINEMSNNALLYVIVASSSQSTCNSALVSMGANMANVRYINASSDSYWTRDYGPWTVFDADHEMRIVDFNYNRPRPNDNLIPSVIANQMGLPYHVMPLNLTGGNIMTDGHGKAMSSNLTLTENSSFSQSQINQIFADYLGVTEYQLYSDPLANSSIDHIDCWAKLLDVDKVLIAQVPVGHTNYNAIEAQVILWQSRTSSYGTPYRIFRVYASNNEPYTNSYIMNRKIYVPQMGTANDAAALQTYQNAMPGYTVLGFSHGTGFLSDDAIHCRVNTIFDPQMIRLMHSPLSSAMAHHPVSIEVEVSHANLLAASQTFVAWAYNQNGPWQDAQLNLQRNGVYSASILAPALGQTLYYWIKVTDSTGRTTSKPLCENLDPFSVTVNIPAPNTAPEISLPASFAIDMNQSLVLDFTGYVSDADSDPLSVSVGDTGALSVQISDLSVTISAPIGWHGSQNLTFTVSDGQENASASTTVIITPVNLPVWTPVTYPNNPAVVHGNVSVFGVPAMTGDIVAAFSGEECRGMGTVTMVDGVALVSIEIHLSGLRETIILKVYSCAGDAIYPVTEFYNLISGEVLGEDEPVPMTAVLVTELATPQIISTGISTSGFTLTWNPVTGAQYYRIYAADSPGADFSLVGTTGNLWWTDPQTQFRRFYKVLASDSPLRQAR